MSEAAVKRQRVLDILDRLGADSVLLSSPAAVNWYLGGSRSHVSLAAPPILSVEVSRVGDTVHVTSNERDRLQSEELPPGIRVVERDWFEPAPGARGILEADAESALRAARQPFLPEESARFRSLGADAAAALTDSLPRAAPTMPERSLAALVAAGLVERGADPLVVLVAGADRLQHRHALPTDAPIGRRALVTVCARRHGLIANLSRWIRFGAARPEEEDADARIRLVEADAFAATRPGAKLAEVLAEIALAYPRHGFDADEWRRHHQGGAAGYAGRDPRAAPDVRDVIVLDQPFAWNPSARGVKIEDTVQLTAAGIAPLTVDPRWPVVDVAGVARPVALEL